MTVSSQDTVFQYVANGVTTTFAYGCQVPTETDLVVYLNDVEQTSGYTTTGIGSLTGGTVIFSAAPASGVAVRIERDIELERTTDYQQNGDFLAGVVNPDFDRIWMALQGHLSTLKRAIVVPKSDTVAPVPLPPSAQRANMMLGFDENGQPTVVVPVAGSAASVLIALAQSTGATLVGYLTGTVASTLDSLVSFMGSARTRLTADRNYYVRTDGNDSNNGLANTAGSAFKTRQRAIDVVMRTVDLNGHNVVINVADGAYTGTAAVSAPWVGDGMVYMTGNAANPANCTVTTANGDCFSCDNGGQLYVTGFKCSTTGSGANFRSYTNGNLAVNNCEHGVCAGSHHECGSGGLLGIYGTPKISGGAVSHLHCGSFGRIFCDVTVAVSIPAAVAMTSYFVGCAEGGTIVVPGMTFTGAGVAGVTGQRYVVHKNAFVQGAPIANAFPGNAAGRTATGGVYKGSATEPWQIMPDTSVNDSVVMYSVDTGTNIPTARFQVDATPVGKGYFFVNGDNCYSSGRTNFGNSAQVVVASGTVDGFSLESQNNLGSGFSPFATSANNAACGYMRRRSSNGDIVGFYRDTTSVGSISVTTTNTAYNTTSDYRLKNYVGPIQGAWERIRALKTADYYFKAEPDVLVHGFIAHELAETHPLAVTGEKDAIRVIPEQDEQGNYSERIEPHYQSIDTSGVIPDLAAALQEAMARIEALEQQLITH